MPKSKSKAKSVVKSEVDRGNPGVMLVTMFAVILAVNAVVFHFANAWYPKQVVLGTYSISYIWALFLSSGVVSLLTTFVFPFISDFSKQMQHMLSPKEMMIVYFFVNFGALWLVTRFSQVFGLGVSSWFVTAVLALLLDVGQGLAMMGLESMKTRKK